MAILVVLIFSILQCFVAEGQSCNEDLIATSSPADKQSPNFPFHYDNNLHCVIHITAEDKTKVVELSFLNFELEQSDDCEKDVLVVYDGVDGGQRLVQHSCGTRWAWPHYPEKVITSGPEATLVLITDSDTTATGFRFRYRMVDQDPATFFIAAPDQTTIQAIRRHSALNFRVQPRGMIEPQAVDYDPVDSHLYYSDKGAMNIGRVHLFDQRTDILHEKSVTDPFGLRLDIVNRLLYWTDSELQIISVSDLEGRQRATIISTDLDKPGAIITEPNQGYIYFTDWGNPAKIERADADGDNRVAIVTEEISSPQGLTIDLIDRNLYWVDALLDTLEKCDVDGANREVLNKFNERDFFAIALDSEGIFMTDEEFGWIELIEKEPTQSSTGFRVHIGQIREPRGITLRPYSDLGDSVPYTCPRNDCSGLCLPKPSNSYVCETVLPRLLVGCPANIFTIIPDNVIDWMEPFAYSPNGLAISKTQTHHPGSEFDVNIHDVSYSFEDEIGNKIYCNFTITVADQFNLLCPKDVSVTVPGGQSETPVYWNPPVDHQGQPLTSGTSNPGVMFPVGQTTVTYTYLTTENIRQTCSFVITVSLGDIDGPVFTNCPANKTEWVSPGKTSFVIRLDDIELENPEDSIVMNPADLGSGFFELYRGPNHISIQAEDGAGNTAWCNFTVTVQVDTVKPVIIGCPDNIMITSKDDHETVIWREPIATDNSGHVNLESSDDPGTSFSIGSHSVTYTASDRHGNVETCSFIVTIESADDLGDGPNSSGEVSENASSDMKNQPVVIIGGVLSGLLLIIILLLVLMVVSCRRKSSREPTEENQPPDYSFVTADNSMQQRNPPATISDGNVHYVSNDNNDERLYDVAAVSLPPPAYQELKINIADELKKTLPPGYN
ncbi:uncharacterized protein [Apostichopus japonicus]|uniref:uncharacterized protein n=1 Tax=Stichopus japonicus TaxID=307972 RepID=UPI003AB58D5A